MEDFSSSRVIRRTFAMIAANWPGLLAGALLLCAGPVFAGELLYREGDISMGLSGPNSIWNDPSPWYFSIVIAIVPSFLFAIWAVCDALARSDHNQTAWPGPGLVLSGLALLILQSVAVLFGCLLLIVPGIILTLMWAVSLPVLVTERPGILKALSRSQELTESSRASIFGLMILLFLVHLVLWFGAAGAGGVIIQQHGPGIASAAVLALPTALIAILRVIGGVAIYQELLWLEECDSREEFSLSKMTSGASPASA